MVLIRRHIVAALENSIWRHYIAGASIRERHRQAFWTSPPYSRVRFKAREPDHVSTHP
jgi:hypothetical protein